jgi:hypothetical protein
MAALLTLQIRVPGYPGSKKEILSIRLNVHHGLDCLNGSLNVRKNFFYQS